MVALSVMMVVVMVVITTPHITTAQLFIPIQQQPPGFNSNCGSARSLGGCQVRLAQCSPITQALSGPAGPVHSVLACLALTTLPSTPQSDYFMGIGSSFLEGSPESLVETAGPATTHAPFRKCVLNSTGLLSPDMSLNRTAVSEKLLASFPSAALGEAVVLALPSCPDHVDLSLAPLIGCLRKACMTFLEPRPTAAPVTLVPRLEYLGAP